MATAGSPRRNAKFNVQILSIKFFEKEFIAKWSDKSADELKAEQDKRADALEELSKEKAAAKADIEAKKEEYAKKPLKLGKAEAEYKEKQKEFFKKEKNTQKSMNLLKEIEEGKRAEL